jgi:uncharacterized membrane protein (UPF0127 family)
MKNKNKNKLWPFFTLIFFIIFLLVNSRYGFLKPKINTIQYVKIAGQSIKVDLALTTAEQQKGLGGRNELKDNEGMLFVFAQPGRYYFWMKGMNFPIDIIWIGENMKVIYLKKNALSESYPETFGSDVNAKYILEVVAGFSEKNNLKEGDSVEFF